MRNSYERFSQVATSVCAHRIEWTVKEKDVNSVFVELWKLPLMSFFLYVFSHLFWCVGCHDSAPPLRRLIYCLRPRVKTISILSRLRLMFPKAKHIVCAMQNNNRGRKKLLVIISPRQSLETRAKKATQESRKRMGERNEPDSWNGKANQWCLSPYMCLTFRSEKLRGVGAVVTVDVSNKLDVSLSPALAVAENRLPGIVINHDWRATERRDIIGHPSARPRHRTIKYKIYEHFFAPKLFWL